MTHNELESRALAILREAGLVAKNLDCSGKLARCGTTEKPQGNGGGYVFHADEWPRITFWNWTAGGEKQTVNLYDKAEIDALSPAERKALRERIAKEAEEAKAATEKRQARVAKWARKIWTSLPSADASNGYLTRKGVPPLGKVRQDSRGRLVLPLYDASGQIQSLQSIAEDSGKRFLPGGKTAGGYFHIPAKGNGKDGPLLIAEGFATAASLHMATGYACLIAFGCHNLKAVAEMARARYPEREIILAADNNANLPNNIGVEKAKEAAQAIGGKLAVCPLPDGRDKADFNDLAESCGLIRVAQEIQAALAGEALPMPDKLPSGFTIRGGKRPGLWHVEPKDNDDPVETWIGAALHVLGETRDEQSRAWGLLLEWKDGDGVAHKWAMPKALLAGKDSGAVLSQLAAEGWRFGSGQRARNLLNRFLAEYESKRRFRCVPRTGWHCGAYVLPDEVLYPCFFVGQVGRVGQAAPDKDIQASHNKKCVWDVWDKESIVLQTQAAHNPFQCAGTLDGWRESVAAWAQGNSRLMLALCASLAAPLLEPLGMESGGLNFTGASSTGKSTALALAASVWGKGAGAGGFVQSWRATANGLEGAAALHSDSLLCLDELGQASGKGIQEASYLLGNGMGKARATQDGAARAVKNWRCLVLSSGEVGLREKLAEEGYRARAGQEVRLVDVPADAGAGLGIFEQLHGHASPQAFADSLRQAACQNYGFAAREFIRFFQKNREEALAGIQGFMARGMDSFCPDNADGQVKRVARRFLLCAAAGEAACEWKLLPWQEGEALDAVQTCFDAWLSERGGAGAGEDADILAQVKLFLEMHGQSRFQSIDAPDAVCLNRVGFRQAEDSGATFYILPEAFKAEVCKGHDPKRAARVLADAGLLIKGEGKNLARRPPISLPGRGWGRVYTVRMGGGEL